MIDIMRTYQNYLGDEYGNVRRVLCGGDQLTVERELGAQKLMMCGDTLAERIGILSQCPRIGIAYCAF